MRSWRAFAAVLAFVAVLVGAGCADDDPVERADSESATTDDRAPASGEASDEAREGTSDGGSDATAPATGDGDESDGDGDVADGDITGTATWTVSHEIEIPWPGGFPDDDGIDRSQVCEDLAAAGIVSGTAQTYSLFDGELTCTVTLDDAPQAPERLEEFPAAYLEALETVQLEDLPEDEFADMGAVSYRVVMVFDGEPGADLPDIDDMDLGMFAFEDYACAAAAEAVDLSGVWEFESSSGFDDEWTVTCRSYDLEADPVEVDAAAVEAFAQGYEFPRT